MLIVVRRSNARSACSLGFKPIVSKRADCARLQMEVCTPTAASLPSWTKTGRVRVAADLVICDERFRSGARASRRKRRRSRASALALWDGGGATGSAVMGRSSSDPHEEGLEGDDRLPPPRGGGQLAVCRRRVVSKRVHALALGSLP
jgi:hypothetical protein